MSERHSHRDHPPGKPSRRPFKRKPVGSKTSNPTPSRRPGPAKTDDTSWEKSADWYDRILGERGSEIYREVVIPGAMRLLAPQRGERVLDLGCGQGVFSRALADAGCLVTGVDAAPSLIKKARTYSSRSPIRYFDRDAADLRGLGEFDAVSAILCLQNMQHLDQVCAATATVLKPGGRALWVLNHPAFRIPRQSSWGFEDERKIQFRRVDAYASTLGVPIVMHPGRSDSESTVSFHRSLQTLTEAAFAAGFRLAGLEEWTSHKESQPGPRARAENRARREFPLFLALLWERHR